MEETTQTDSKVAESQPLGFRFVMATKSKALGQTPTDGEAAYEAGGYPCGPNDEGVVEMVLVPRTTTLHMIEHLHDLVRRQKPDNRQRYRFKQLVQQLKLLDTFYQSETEEEE